MVQFYQYGQLDPSRNRYSSGPNEPIVYTYVPPQLQQTIQTGPPAPVATGGMTTVGPVQFSMTQQISSNMPIQAGQAITAPYISPQPLQQHPQYTVPAGTVAWPGATVAQVNARNAAIAGATGATRPQSMIPYQPAEGQQWWCREVDGSYTLRTTTDIMDNLYPSGRWDYSPAGYPYFVRHAAPA
ncbi:hypothetical protein FQN57_000638 [Myotisia sp. PD_48]|nr:hypothetical protein FQN57_000638 [Myotisia sp. PD_48]